MFNRADYLLESGRLMSFAFPGGYPLYYVAKDSGVLCPDCASLPECQQATPDDSQWYIVGADCNWEDTALVCEHCGKRIESAYCEEAQEGSAGERAGVNLDCAPISDLQAYCDNADNPAPLREYAATKIKAMQARLAGNIAAALAIEAGCETLYQQLPPSMQW
jgi:Fe2+ or Zn2+ uptake regulation protein